MRVAIVSAVALWEVATGPLSGGAEMIVTTDSQIVGKRVVRTLGLVRGQYRLRASRVGIPLRRGVALTWSAESRLAFLGML